MWPDDAKLIVDNMADALKSLLDDFMDMYKEFEKLAYEVQEEIDARAEERERWGHPPKRLIAAYSQPMKKIRPHARTFGRR